MGNYERHVRVVPSALLLTMCDQNMGPEENMDRPIESVDIVSDGILVRFADGLLSYFSHEFLRGNVGMGSNQVFLDRNPSSETRTFKVSPDLLRPVN